MRASLSLRMLIQMRSQRKRAKKLEVDPWKGEHKNQIHRHILLSVISELWVDYLTRVDALRVSIGLEAFAQRDPLVQYKGQASEMFRALLSDIRAGVISRMFLFQPRRPGGQAADRPATDSTPTVKTESSEVSVEKKKKRKRH